MAEQSAEHKHVCEIADLALEIIKVAELEFPQVPTGRIRLRMGIHSGKSLFYSKTRIYRISADCEIYPIYLKSNIYEGTSIFLYYEDQKFHPIYPIVQYLTVSDISEF